MKVQRKTINNNLHSFNVKNNISSFRNFMRCYLSFSGSSYCCCYYYYFLYVAIIIFLNLTNIALCNNDDNTVNTAHNENIAKYTNDSLWEARELYEDSTGFVWSELLEDYVLSQSASGRTSKDLPYMGNMHEMSGYQMMNPNMAGAGSQNLQPPINYHSSAYRRPGNIVITKRIGEASELEPHMRPPVVNPQFRPMTTNHVQQPNFFQQLFGIGGGNAGAVSSGPTPPPPPPQQQQQPMRPISLQQQQHYPPHQSGGTPQNIRAVTENDLYLLGAIEKLVYRVDYLESRIRRSEQLIYYLMAGNNQKEVRDPCPTNFTHISDNCYYINSHQQVNWKTANSACKALNSHLAEFDKVSENEEIMAYLLNQPNHRGHDFWLGGLNPGLLWIWANSAKPVNPNMNLTSIAMSHENATTTESNSIETDADDKEKKNPDAAAEETNKAILNNIVEIKGQGRCLRLSYNPGKHSYMYYGQECTSRHHYICEYEDKTLDNKIKKITRDLKLFD